MGVGPTEGSLGRSCCIICTFGFSPLGERERGEEGLLSLPFDLLKGS